MKFSQTIKRVDPALVVSRRHERWIEINDHPVYSDEALRFAHEQLAKLPRERRGTVSASSLGECPRYQQFVYLGMPKMLSSVQNLSRMHNGVFMHLRWQMEGLTEGWLTRAEVPVDNEAHKLRGTLDGILYDGSILELKSINARGFSQVMTFGPLREHLFQMAVYMLCSWREKGVFIYECKDNQEYTEVVVGKDDLPLAEAADQAKALWSAVEAQRLYEPLEKCIDQNGWKYQSCPFRDRCLAIHTWEQASVPA